MVRKTRHMERSGWVVLLTDDDEAYAQATRILLEREGHTVLEAHSGEEALEVLAREHVDLLLLDYFMHGMTGEDVVQSLRASNTALQIILQTGYASEQPPRELLKRLDIQGYHDKSEGPEKLLMWVDVGLKAAYAAGLVNKSRQGMRYILSVTPQMHRMQPLEDLLQGIICQVSGLLGVANSFLACRPSNATEQKDDSASETATFLAMRKDDAELVVHAGTGRFAGLSALPRDNGDSALTAHIATAIQSDSAKVWDHATFVPLRVGEVSIGVIYLDRAIHIEQDLELLSVFANQAAVAVHNSQLFEMATVDPLTGTYLRRFIEQWIVRELRSAFRQQQPITLLMVDMDGLKHINDSAGHLVGDEALAALGRVLRQSLRGSDVAGRFGGDEFVVVLPNTSRERAGLVAARIVEQLQQTQVEGDAAAYAVRASIGMASLEAHGFDQAALGPLGPEYFQGMLKVMLESADGALYTAKRGKRGQLESGAACTWRPLRN